jgi:hypothetical protein
MAGMARTLEVRARQGDEAPPAEVDAEQARKDRNEGVTRIIPKRAPVSFVD